MLRKRLRYIPVLILVIVFLLGFFGCTQHKIYRSPNQSIFVNTEDLAADEAIQAEVETHCVELHDDFDMGFVEFDDQGDFWSREQLAALQLTLGESAERPDTDGLLIVTFVHGWKHNAQVCDENVSCMREILVAVANAERLRALRNYQVGGSDIPRRVVGVYVGWRGLSITTPVIKELSFYARKSTAHRVGAGEVIELITTLEAHRDQLNDRSELVNKSRLVTIGHSFGAAVTYTAISKIMHARLSAASLDDVGETTVKAFGDLVVLVNPAFEASLYSGIHNIASERESYAEGQKPVLAVVSSETDTATGKAFPAGRFFSTLFQKTSSKEQKKALRTSLGNYEPYRTHEATIADQTGRGFDFFNDIIEIEPGAARGAADCKCSYVDVESLSRSDLRLLADTSEDDLFPSSPGEEQYGPVVLRSTGNGGSAQNPFYVIGATDEIVTQHNGIYNQVFIDFLRFFVLATDNP